jgi:hypothetical protein
MAEKADFDSIKKRAEEIQASYLGRNTMFNEMEDMFFLNWSEEKKVRSAIENVKVTLSPDPRNQIMGAVRLIVATDPVFSIPSGLNDPNVQAISEKIERFAEKMWQAAGKVSGRPVHYDAALSAFLYGEVHIAIISTRDLLKAAEPKSEAIKNRAAKTARRTPYLYEVWNPKDCYTEFDNQGLISHYRRTETTIQNIRIEFGDDANHLTGKPYDKVFICEWWDLTHHLIWVEGIDTPLMNEIHGLPFIPIVVGVTDGSTNLFSKAEEQRQPFLYAINKSGLWHRQNLSLTVMYTMLHGIGANPMFLYRSTDPENELDVNWDVPGGYAQIGPNEDFTPLAKQIIDPNMWQALSEADRLTAESTIYKQTLGEPLGKNAPFSMVALLSQSGRLPLISPQRILGWAVGSAVEMALEWIKLDDEEATAVYEGEKLELDPEEIPEDFEIEATLDVNMPQDDLQNANIARMLTEGDDPLVSNEWVLKNVLSVEQPSEMRDQIWSESAANLRFLQYVTHQLVLNQEKMQRAMMPPVPPEQMAGQVPPGAPLPEQELPPEPAPGVEGMPQVMAEGGGAEPLNPNQPPPGLV